MSIIQELIAIVRQQQNSSLNYLMVFGMSTSFCANWYELVDHLNIEQFPPTNGFSVIVHARAVFLSLLSSVFPTVLYGCIGPQ